MHRLLAFVPVVLVLLVGCASGHETPGSKTNAGEIAQIQRRLEQIVEAAEKKDFEKLEGYHLYGPHFTKFSTESPYVQDSEIARKGERDGLSAVNGLKMQVADLKIDVFGDAAVATYMLNYSFMAGEQTIEKQAKMTMVFVKESKEWKIAHEHLSATSAK